MPTFNDVGISDERMNCAASAAYAAYRVAATQEHKIETARPVRAAAAASREIRTETLGGPDRAQGQSHRAAGDRASGMCEIIDLAGGPDCEREQRGYAEAQR